MRELAQRVDVPLVLDADGLNALGGRLEELRHRRWPTVLTPHAGELGRLLEVESAEVERARLHHVRAAAGKAKALVVLKGDDTLVVGAVGPRGDLARRRARPRHGGDGRRAVGRDGRDARQGPVARARRLRGGARCTCARGSGPPSRTGRTA